MNFITFINTDYEFSIKKYKICLISVAISFIISTIIFYIITKARSKPCQRSIASASIPAVLTDTFWNCLLPYLFVSRLIKISKDVEEDGMNTSKLRPIILKFTILNVTAGIVMTIFLPLNIYLSKPIHKKKKK